jgi:hypothetical protein
MKVKLFPSIYWGTLIGCFLSFAFLAIAIFAFAFQSHGQNMNDFMAVLIMGFFHLIMVIQSIVQRKEVFSTVSITDKGIVAMYMGNKWFSIKWDEVVEVGELVYSKLGVFSKFTFDGIYVSKIPDALNRKLLLFSGLPDYNKLDGNILFISINDKKRKEIFKHVDESIIIQHGDCKLK